MELKKLDQLVEDVCFRETQLNLLFDLLIRQDKFIYPVLHLFGLSGTGKTYLMRKFINKFHSPTQTQQSANSKYFIYMNCKEMCHASISSFFNEIILQLQNFIMKTNEMFSNLDNNYDDDENIDDESRNNFKLKTANDLSEHMRQIKFLINKLALKSNGISSIYLVIDNAEYLKHFKDSNNLFLMLCKLNEHLNVDKLNDYSIPNEIANVCVLFITEMDWHSLLSDCDVMSRTEAPRPFVIFFNDFTKEQMKLILQKSSKFLVAMQNYTNSGQVNIATEKEHLESVQFYSKTILDVFHPICKDLNEIQYLIQIYYDQVLNTISNTASINRKEKSSYEKMLTVWNSMKPFLKQALTQIYLRNSITNSDDLQITKEFENITLKESAKSTDLNNSCNQLPKLMKFLLISSYIATHNPVKYDKKLFEYNSMVKSRKTKFTAQKFQQTEENQRAAALKSQSFEINRLLAIFFAISTEYNLSNDMNLNLILSNLKSLKSLQYLQQMNGSYSNIDEPKFKCLLDFETINQISISVDFNLKQYLAEYLTI